MTTITIPLSAIVVTSTSPAVKYGSVAKSYISTTQQVLARAALTGIPSTATVSSASLQVWQRTAGTGSVPMTAKANTAGWSTATTWNTKPATTTTNQGTQTRSAPAAGSQWVLDVTALVQSWVSGTVANNGVLISTSVANTASGTFFGQAASSLRPQLVVTYSTTAPAPTALNPTGGSVSKAKTTLTFQVASDTQSIQVQIDPAANGTTPGFDSGEIVSSAGLLDLNTTAYAGLADGATTQFRARAKNALGWSAWSSWVSFTRTAWKTLAITSPSATPEDPSPTIQATYATGTITAWEALTRNPAGATVQSSGWTAGSTVSYATTTSVGSSGTAVVRIRDNVTRVATPGDPDHLEATQAFTVTPSGTPTVIASLAATQDGVRPWVTLTGTRGTIPDEVVIYRDGNLVGRATGASCFTGTAFSYSDKTAPMNASTAYTVRAVASGAFSNASNTATVTPKCQGIWLCDLEDNSEAVIWGAEELEQTQPEVAVEHTPLSGTAQVVRRRLARYPRQGTIEGELVLALGVSALTSEANLRAWADQDAGHLYQLVLGNQSDTVILGNIEFSEVALNGKERILGVALDWWKQV